MEPRHDDGRRDTQSAPRATPTTVDATVGATTERLQSAIQELGQLITKGDLSGVKPIMIYHFCSTPQFLGYEATLESGAKFFLQADKQRHRFDYGNLQNEVATVFFKEPDSGSGIEVDNKVGRDSVILPLHRAIQAHKERVVGQFLKLTQSREHDISEQIRAFIPNNSEILTALLQHAGNIEAPSWFRGDVEPSIVALDRALIGRDIVAVAMTLGCGVEVRGAVVSYIVDLHCTTAPQEAGYASLQLSTNRNASPKVPEGFWERLRGPTYIAHDQAAERIVRAIHDCRQGSFGLPDRQDPSYKTLMSYPQLSKWEPATYRGE